VSPNRIVALLTPLVFAPLAGAVSAWLAKHVPDAEISQENLMAVFIGGALIALAPALQWLHGWQKFEAREADIGHAVDLANAAGLPAIVPMAETFEEFEDDGLDENDEFDDLEFDDELNIEFDELDEEFDAVDEVEEEPAPTGS
jgi:hypothetical protein